FNVNSGRQFGSQAALQLPDLIFGSGSRAGCLGLRFRRRYACRHRTRRREINSVGIDLNHLRSMRVEPVDHLLQQIAPDLRDTRCGIEVGEMSLRESKVTVEAVKQNLERILQRLEVMLSRRISFSPHFCFCFEPEVAEIREQMSKDLQLIRRREAV